MIGEHALRLHGEFHFDTVAVLPFPSYHGVSFLDIRRLLLPVDREVLHASDRGALLVKLARCPIRHANVDREGLCLFRVHGD